MNKLENIITWPNILLTALIMAAVLYILPPQASLFLCKAVTKACGWACLALLPLALFR